MDTRKIMLVSTDGHSNVYANIGQIKVPISFTTPAIHIANLAYRNDIAYDDIVWSDTINPGLRFTVYDLMWGDFPTFKVTLTHRIDPQRDIATYVKAPSRLKAIEHVAAACLFEIDCTLYDADATLAPNAPNTNNP